MIRKKVKSNLITDKVAYETNLANDSVGRKNTSIYRYIETLEKVYNDIPISVSQDDISTNSDLDKDTLILLIQIRINVST